jgi:hypothetical protein
MNVIFNFTLGFGFYIESVDDAIVQDDETGDMMMTGGLIIAIPFCTILIFGNNKGE